MKGAPARLAAERALENREARLRAILEVAVDGIVIIDARGTIETFNPGAERIFGYPAGDVLGQNVGVLMNSGEATAHDGYVRRYLDTGAARIIGTIREVDGRRRDGTVVPLELSMSEARCGGETFFVGLVRDVSERRRHEAELKRSNAELEQFAYVASHDLQEPLRMVTGYCELLRRRHADKLDPEARQFIDFAVDGATRMQGLIEALLAYAMVGSKRRPFTLVDLGEVVRLAMSNLATAIAESGAQVVVHNLGFATPGNEAQLVQLFQNLIGNAIKYRRPGVAALVEIGATAQDGLLTITIRDNGIGIEPRFAERIFQVFRRLHTQSESPGTGIGLAIAKRIVERHGGRIWLDTGQRDGCTFRLTLPQGTPGPA